MHEHSLVRNLLRQVGEVCLRHAGARVAEVCVEVGPLSGVEPLLLTSAFEQYTPGTCAATARLVIDQVPLLATCRHCGHDMEIRDFVFRCCRCGGNVDVTCGEEVQLVSVSLEPAARAASPACTEPSVPWKELNG